MNLIALSARCARARSCSSDVQDYHTPMRVRQAHPQPRVQFGSESQAARPERLREIVFQTNDIQMAVVVFVKFVAIKTATNSTN
ncbi:MAG: hypothetical protein DMG08_12725 [Acidobacteria bacterium]|nr:MAG: hypothetical protein DMG08_12725 [Acidobacteriota bacterium]